MEIEDEKMNERLEKMPWRCYNKKRVNKEREYAHF
jgi:hypothetical protein